MEKGVPRGVLYPLPPARCRKQNVFADIGVFRLKITAFGPIFDGFFLTEKGVPPSPPPRNRKVSMTWVIEPSLNHGDPDDHIDHIDPVDPDYHDDSSLLP